MRHRLVYLHPEAYYFILFCFSRFSWGWCAVQYTSTNNFCIVGLSPVISWVSLRRLNPKTFPTFWICPTQWKCGPPTYPCKANRSLDSWKLSKDSSLPNGLTWLDQYAFWKTYEILTYQKRTQIEVQNGFNVHRWCHQMIASSQTTCIACAYLKF